MERTEADGRGGGASGLTVALLALTRYRRRGRSDTPGLECLLVHAARDAGNRGRRRLEVVERAGEEYGLPEADAMRIYDIAVEEGLDPVFGMDLVGCGVGVSGGVAAPEAEETVHVRGAPEWLGGPVDASEAERERRLRASFRRLRGLLERCDTPEAALTAFFEEPDVEERAF